MPNLLTLLVQIAVIIVAARLMGLLFRKLHQPQVVGETIAGIMLGPSLFGWLTPDFSAQLFPPKSLGFLNAISQLGVVVFMFLVGLKLDPAKLRGLGLKAVVISHSSIAAPFLLGCSVAFYLYPRLSEGSVQFMGFALFMGAAMSVTAFPVLARILAETNLSRTRAGSLAITCAAVDDVTAWCLLAAVVILIRTAAVEMPLWLTLGGTAIFSIVMVFGIRRALRLIEVRYHNEGKVTQDVLAVILLLMLLSASITEWLGIHALFGAFLLGAIMPKHPEFLTSVVSKLEDLTIVFLLPLFFAFTGLRTSIGLVSGIELWLYCGLILAVAIIGKYGGSALSAYFMGIPWSEASAIGILMNTRGLMELVILNIGLDIGAISPTIFAMMILMAIITTLMTTPMLKWTYLKRPIPEILTSEHGAPQTQPSLH